MDIVLLGKVQHGVGCSKHRLSPGVSVRTGLRLRSVPVGLRRPCSQGRGLDLGPVTRPEGRALVVAGLGVR